MVLIARMAYVTVGLLMLMAATCQAASITVENYSFEQPGQGKIKGWNGEGSGGTPAVDIPGWSGDTAAFDSGVETGYNPTGGDYSAFLRSGDPSVWQLTDCNIVAGEVYDLKVDAQIT